MSGSEKRAPRDSRKVNVLTAEQEDFFFNHSNTHT